MILTIMQSISFSMPESDPDFLVLNLIAIDLDSDDLVYTITKGNEMDYFKINTSTGAVTVKNPPDREKNEIYTLTVVADDGMQNVRYCIYMYIGFSFVYLN